MSGTMCNLRVLKQDNLQCLAYILDRLLTIALIKFEESSVFFESSIF